MCSCSTLVVLQVSTSPMTSACTLGWLQWSPIASDIFPSYYQLLYLQYYTLHTGNYGCTVVTSCDTLLSYFRNCRIAIRMRLSWSGLWLLIMLLYTDVVNTSVSVLNCPILSDSSGRKSPVWYHLHNVLECIDYLCICRDGMLMVRWSALLENILHWQFQPF